MAFKNFRAFWVSLTPAQKQQLAVDADSSYKSLANVSKGHRGIGIDLADRLRTADERITKAMTRAKNP